MDQEIIGGALRCIITSIVWCVLKCKTRSWLMLDQKVLRHYMAKDWYADAQKYVPEPGMVYPEHIGKQRIQRSFGIV